MKVLVTYDSKYGATEEIAAHIAKILTAESVDACLLPVSAVDSIDKYDAVIAGSAVYIGRWRKNAKKFVTDHIAALEKKRVWIFSSGPTGEGIAVELLQGWRYPENLKDSIEKIQPEGIEVFHGAVTLEKLGFIDKWLATKVKSPVGDYRDFDLIKKFAQNIVSSLL